MADLGPFGALKGMYYDPAKKRYFPLDARKAPTPHSAADLKAISVAMMGTTEGIASRHGIQSLHKKRGRKADLWDVNECPEVGRRIRRIQRSTGRSESSSQLRVENHLSRSTLYGVSEFGQCHGENITSIKSFGTGAVCMTTDHGKIIWDSSSERDLQPMSVCSQKLFGMHCDVLRGTWIAVSNGAEPHIHSWRRDHANPMHPISELPTIDFPHKDIWAMDSFDDMTAIASSRALHTVRLGEASIHLSRRKLPSDPLAVHHVSRDTVFAGLRSSSVVMEDTRLKSWNPNVVASLPAGRAIIGVKRLQDSAVPFGLVVSGMSHQLMLFDVRFSRTPLLELKGHVNTYQQWLALATSPDDTVVLAGGSDKRLRAWSTITGQPIEPPSPSPTTTAPRQRGDARHRHSALSMSYRYDVHHVDVAEDLTLRVASAGDVLRFLPQRDTPRKRLRGD